MRITFALIIWFGLPLAVETSGEMPLTSDDGLAIATIAREARGEPYIGKVAVAEVIRNRMDQKYQSDGTVLGTVSKPHQFSGWSRAIEPLSRASREILEECRLAWETAKSGSQIAPGALLFYAPKLAAPPSWARPTASAPVSTIGGHRFYRPILLD